MAVIRLGPPNLVVLTRLYRKRPWAELAVGRKPLAASHKPRHFFPRIKIFLFLISQCRRHGYSLW